jgi:gliding motility-associated-like protein
MSRSGKQYQLLPGRKLFLLAVGLLFSCSAFGQDDCSAAMNVTLTGGGYGTGLVTSSVITITPATVQPGESFSPTNSAAGQTEKTIWYKFNLPTSRSITIRLDQNTASIASGDVGFAVYKTSSCVPVNADLSTRLSPVTVFGTTTSNCLEPGDYLVQVAARSSANGSVYIQIQTGMPTSSPFDHTSEAYDFGTLSPRVTTVDYRVECQSTDNASEVCNSLPNYSQFTKSTWHVFTTPNYFDYVSLFLANQFLPAGQTYGINIYKGDVRSSAISLVGECGSLTSNTYRSAQKTFTCSDFESNTTYSIQLFYHQNFTDNVELSLITAGIVPTGVAQPLLSTLLGNNDIVLTPTTLGSSANPQDYLGCNSRHSVTSCSSALPSVGINYKGRNFNLSSFFRLTLSAAAAVTLDATPACGPPLLVRLYRQGLTNNCSDLAGSSLVSESIGTASLPSCLPSGVYVVQVSGTDSAIANTFSYGSLSTGSAVPCLLSNFGSSFSLNVSATTPVPTIQHIDSTLCSGSIYTLSNGTVINTDGIYKDTLRSSYGCDSLLKVLNLSFKTKIVERLSASLCSGQTYILPWGKVVSTPGTYTDTVKYITGCDSLVRIVNLQPLSPPTLVIDAFICKGDSLRLPWGPFVTKEGAYRDTLRNVAGCDSFITMVGVAIRAGPVVTVSRSNDINCTLGSARLTATGGGTYSWWPATGLDRADVFNPVAAPSVTTTYHVQVRSFAGCTAEDSMEVPVSRVPSDNSFLVPNAFTPNGDGVNDCFGVHNWGAVSELHFSIYDRWGNQVFYTETPSECWDGNSKGSSLPSGTYVYTISAKSACGDVTRKGTVTLIR